MFRVLQETVQMRQYYEKQVADTEARLDNANEDVCGRAACICVCVCGACGACYTFRAA
jgi:hypothetical protein